MTDMDLAQVPSTELTQDPFELDILTDESIDLIEPDDPHYQECARLTSRIAALSRTIGPKRINIANALLRGVLKPKIIKEQRTSHTTIKSTIEDPRVQQYVVCRLRLVHIRKGPTMDARASLLWRIAIREEKRQPSISIKAVDTLNKQQGVYLRDDHGDGSVTVHINQFVLADNTRQPTALPDDNKPAIHTIEGEFTSITVEVPD